MPIEILAFTLKSEISIGDIATTLGLFVSATAFWVGFKLTRRNDQIKLWIETTRRLDELLTDLFAYMKTNPHMDISFTEKEKKERIVETTKRFHRIHTDLEILTVLKAKGDISSELVETEKKSVIKRLEDMKRIHYEIKGNPDLKQWHEPDNFEDLKKVWMQSKLELFFSGLKIFFHVK